MCNHLKYKQRTQETIISFYSKATFMTARNKKNMFLLCHKYLHCLLFFFAISDKYMYETCV